MNRNKLCVLLEREQGLQVDLIDWPRLKQRARNSQLTNTPFIQDRVRAIGSAFAGAVIALVASALLVVIVAAALGAPLSWCVLLSLHKHVRPLSAAHALTISIPTTCASSRALRHGIHASANLGLLLGTLTTVPCGAAFGFDPLLWSAAIQNRCAIKQQRIVCCVEDWTMDLLACLGFYRVSDLFPR